MFNSVYSLGLKFAQQRNVPERFKSDYAEGFAKAAQATDPSWFNEYIPALWHRENAARTGYDPRTKRWSPYKDFNRGNAMRSAIGPGVIVKPTQTYADSEMPSAVLNSVRQHYQRAKLRYPGLETHDPNIQKLFLDVTYAGAGKYPKLWNAVNSRDRAAAMREYKMYYTPPGGKRTANVRRNALNLNEFLRPHLDTWKQ